MKTIETTYIKADETIDTILLDLNCKIVYVYYKNGYARFFKTFDAIHNYLNGTDIRGWFYMCEDKTEVVDSVLKALEKGIAWTD
jgi:hypothetical protein